MRTIGLIVSLSLLACASPQRANLAQLQYRAVFDLGCPADQLWLYHIDGRTKAVTGCGKRLVYLEQCDSGAGNTCSWQLDTPSFAQTQWPAPMTAPVTPQPAPTVATTQGRTIRTDLFGAGRAPMQTRERPMRTELFPPAPVPQPPASTPRTEPF